MKLFTIGSSQKSAEEFFDLLLQNDVRSIVDIRLYNNTVYSGFTRKMWFPYFLEKIGKIDYIEMKQCAPTPKLFKEYQNDELTWKDFRKQYLHLIKERQILNYFSKKMLNRSCLLCAEPEHYHCHRKILSEYLARNYSDISVIHL